MSVTRISIAVFCVLFVLAGVGGAVFGLGLLDDAGGTSGEADGPSQKVAGRDGGRVEVGPSGPGNGTVILRVRPPGKSSVRITRRGSDYKEKWNSTAALELVGLPAGLYETKVSPLNGKSLRATFEVNPGQACELTLDTTAGSEWVVGDCGDVR
jgi:hypothetical protein